MFLCFKWVFTLTLTFHYIGIEHVFSDVNSSKPTNHNAGISILCPGIKAGIPAYVSQFVFGNNGGHEKVKWENEKCG